jgi:amino acid transporter
VLSSASRLITYGLVCAALLAFRRKQPDATAYRLPFGRIFAAVGIALMIALLTRITREELAWILATGAVAFLNWIATRRHVVPVAAAREL